MFPVLDWERGIDFTHAGQSWVYRGLIRVKGRGDQNSTGTIKQPQQVVALAVTSLALQPAPSLPHYAASGKAATAIISTADTNKISHWQQNRIFAQHVIISRAAVFQLAALALSPPDFLSGSLHPTTLWEELSLPHFLHCGSGSHRGCVGSLRLPASLGKQREWEVGRQRRV